MRTFIVVVFVALAVAVGMAFYVGLVGVTTDEPEGKYIVTFTINTSMVSKATAPADVK